MANTDDTDDSLDAVIRATNAVAEQLEQIGSAENITVPAGDLRIILRRLSDLQGFLDDAQDMGMERDLLE